MSVYGFECECERVSETQVSMCVRCMMQQVQQRRHCVLIEPATALLQLLQRVSETQVSMCVRFRECMHALRMLTYADVYGRMLTR
jgi:hypothetical protein